MSVNGLARRAGLVGWLLLRIVWTATGFRGVVSLQLSSSSTSSSSTLVRRPSSSTVVVLVVHSRRRRRHSAAAAGAATAASFRLLSSSCPFPCHVPAALPLDRHVPHRRDCEEEEEAFFVCSCCFSSLIAASLRRDWVI